MQNGIAETNPFKRLAEQEREQKKLEHTEQQQPDQEEQSTETAHVKPKIHLERPPIPNAPSLISTQQVANSPVDESGDDYSNFVDSYAAGDDSDDDSSSDDEIPQPIDLDNLIPIPSKMRMSSQSHPGQHPQPQLQIPILPNVHHSDDDDNSPDTSLLAHVESPPERPLIPQYAEPRYEPSTEYVDHSQLTFAQLAHQLQQSMTQPSTPVTPVTQQIPQAHSTPPETSTQIPISEPIYSTPVIAEIPATERFPPVSEIPETRPAPVIPQSHHESNANIPVIYNENILNVNTQPISANYNDLPITVDPSTFPNASHNFNDSSFDDDDDDEDETPAAPVRPPQLPNRRLSQRLSSLDPGSSSTVGSHSFYGNYGGYETAENNDQGKDAPPVPAGVSSTSHRPDLYQTPNLLDSEPQSPRLPRRPVPQMEASSLGEQQPEQQISQPSQTSAVYSRPPIPVSQNYLNSQQNTGSSFASSVIPINYSSPALPQSTFQPPNAENSYSRTSSISQSVTGSRTSLPIITVTTPEGTAPMLPKKPMLPKRPARLSSGSASAYELLENYGRRTSVAHPQESIAETSTSTQTEPMVENPIAATSNDDLDLASLRSLGITDEMIRQQREIEARIQSENLHSKKLKEQLAAASSDRDHISLPNISITADTTTASLNESISSDISGGSDEIPDDISQLEIPTNLSRSSSFSGDDNHSTLSTISAAPALNEEITEEQFIESLPPVPKYTEHADLTEISIPNGMAINMETINESHPKENPPEYTPVSEALKKIINRPQFSQTGGDTLSIRRREQERLRLEEEERRRQSEHHHRHSTQPSGRTSSSASSSSRRHTTSVDNYRSSSSANSSRIRPSSSSSRPTGSSTRVSGTSSRASGSSSRTNGTSSTRRLPPAPTR